MGCGREKVEGEKSNKLTRSATVFDVDWSLPEKLVHMFKGKKTEKISKKLKVRK